MAHDDDAIMQRRTLGDILAAGVLPRRCSGEMRPPPMRPGVNLLRAPTLRVKPTLMVRPRFPWLAAATISLLGSGASVGCSVDSSSDAAPTVNRRVLAPNSQVISAGADFYDDLGRRWQCNGKKTLAKISAPELPLGATAVSAGISSMTREELAAKLRRIG